MELRPGITAVVTGAAQGIGLALATGFGARGCNVVLADIDGGGAQAAAERLAAEGVTTRAVQTDCRDVDSVQALAAAVDAEFGGADVVCNNAGVAVGGLLADSTPADWDFVLGINLFGVVHGIRAFVPGMIARGRGGHVVNTASMAGLVGMEGLGIYCASKYAVVGMSESLAKELRPHRIGVSVLCPMIVDTQISRNSLRMHTGVDPGEIDPAAAGMAGGIVAADDVAARTLTAIEAGRLFVLTHPEQVDVFRRRTARVEAAFDPAWPNV